MQSNEMVTKSILAMYPTIKDFMKEYNPNRQTIIASEPEKCFFGNSPTLAILNNVYGNNAAAAWLVPELYEISIFCGLKELPDQGQLIKTAKIISYHYHWLKVDELQLFFFRFCASCYKQFYSYYNPQIILQSLQDFIRERTAAYQRKENEERWKRYEIAQRNAITYKEYERIKPFMGIDKSI